MQRKNRVAIILNTPRLGVEVKEKNVICADGGYLHLPVGAFFNVTVVGDFDSLKNVDVPYEKIIVNREKDFTDGLLSLKVAKEKEYECVTLYGIDGGRIDHVYNNISLLKSAKLMGINAKAETETATILYKDKGTYEFDLPLGTGFSILPYCEKVIVESSTGLYYPYENLTLYREDTRGISNVTTNEKVSITINEGDCLVFILK